MSAFDKMMNASKKLTEKRKLERNEKLQCSQCSSLFVNHGALASHIKFKHPRENKVRFAHLNLKKGARKDAERH